MRPTILGVVVAVFFTVDLIFVYRIFSNEIIMGTNSLIRNNADHNSPHDLMNVRIDLKGINKRVQRNPQQKFMDGRGNIVINDQNIKRNNTSSFTSKQLKILNVVQKRGMRRIQDKIRLLEVLSQGGFDFEKDDLDQETIDALPSWNQITKLYGSEPVILGLERCEQFRSTIEPTTRFFGIAGTFNTGTNLVADLMKFNCEIVERMKKYGAKSKGVRWQVPWGKHFMARYRNSNHTTNTDADVPKDHTLPIVVIRDPYTWMQSMCRHKYAANWPHNKYHCPNLIATKEDVQNFPKLRAIYSNVNAGNTEKLIPITINYKKNPPLAHNHSSFAHWYSEWYNEYYNADYPRVMVRFEDLLFHGEKVTRDICRCGGGVARKDNGRKGEFKHVSESAKKGLAAHGKMADRTNLVGAIIKYGSGKNRIASMTKDDLIAARKYLDPNMMRAFNYQHPPLNPPSSSKSMEDVIIEMNGKTVVGTDAGRYDDDHSQKPNHSSSQILN